MSRGEEVTVDWEPPATPRREVGRAGEADRYFEGNKVVVGLAL